jgi:hypothetical protein
MERETRLNVKINTVAAIDFDLDEIIDAINMDRNRSQRWNIVAKLINQIELDGQMSTEQMHLIATWLENKLKNFKLLTNQQ